MPIDFPKERWEYLRKVYEGWWNKTLDRPVIQAVLTGEAPGPQPPAPILSQKNSLDLSIPVEALLDRLDYEFSRRVYLGDAFPSINFDVFGPGCLAAFLGAVPDNRTGEIWFHPPAEKPIQELHFEYDPENIWFSRIKSIYLSAQERWGSGVVLGMPDLGGTLDILASFTRTDNLLYALYDAPREVKRLVGEIHALWLRYYQEFNSLLKQKNEGFTDWSDALSAAPCYILQSDFSYMISTEMFGEFVLEDLRAFTEEIPHTIYHLDGKGQVKHLDMLLGLAGLDAVQWVPGDGAPGQKHWPEIYRRIAGAGKGVHLWEDFDTLREVAGQTGSARGLLLRRPVGQAQERQSVLARLGDYGALSPWDKMLGGVL